MTHRKLEIKNIGGSPRCFGKIIFPYYLVLQSVTTKTGKIIFPDYLVLQSVNTKTWLHCSCSCCSPAWVRCPKSATKGQWNGVNWRERKRKEKMLAGQWNLTACSLQIGYHSWNWRCRCETDKQRTRQVHQTAEWSYLVWPYLVPAGVS